MTQIAPESPSPAVPAPRGRGCAPWLIGCGVTLLVVLVLGGAAAWWFVGRPLLAVYDAIQQVERIETFDARVRNRTPFVEPAGALLEEVQLTRYLAVQRRMGDELVDRLGRLEGRFRELDGRTFAWTDVFLLGQAYSDFFGMLVETKEAQVAALDEQGFSVAEYAWVRREVLRAAGLAAAPDLGSFVAGLTGGDGVAPALLGGDAPQANRELVERYRDVLDERVFLAVIGL
jgi:hypothetical protein